MTTIEERKALRKEILEAAYEANEMDPSSWLKIDAWGSARKYEADEIERATSWLVDHEFLRPMGHLGGEITTAGIDEIESLDSGYDLSVLTSEDRGLAEKAIAEILRIVEVHGDDMDRDDVADLEAQASTITAQIRSPRARPRIIGAAAAAAKWTAESIGSEITGAVGLAAVLELAHRLGLA